MVAHGVAVGSHAATIRQAAVAAPEPLPLRALLLFTRKFPTGIPGTLTPPKKNTRNLNDGSSQRYALCMNTLTEIEAAITQLSPEDLSAFRKWLANFDAAQWDRQFEEDVAAGRL